MAGVVLGPITQGICTRVIVIACRPHNRCSYSYIDMELRHPKGTIDMTTTQIDEASGNVSFRVSESSGQRILHPGPPKSEVSTLVLAKTSGCAESERKRNHDKVSGAYLSMGTLLLAVPASASQFRSLEPDTWRLQLFPAPLACVKGPPHLRSLRFLGWHHARWATRRCLGGRLRCVESHLGWQWLGPGMGG